MTSSSLIAACITLFLVFFLLLLAYGLLRRYQQKQISGTSDTPLHQLQLKQLKKNTQADFGVAYHELEFGKLLGKGSQGEVYRATWRGSYVAVKKIDTRKVPPEIIEEFCQEAEIMKRLRHPSLTLFMGVSLEHPHLCIVTEIVNRGSLFDIIHDETSAMTWKKCLSIAVDVAQGMTYLHGHSPPILHRDLKSLNILVDDNWRAKVADFGMTRFSEEGATMTQCGSPLWMAPEMIKNDPYDEKSDVYSFGICLWELYTRKIPYRELGLNPSHLVVKVVKEALRPSIPKQCPRPYVKLMEKCWHPLPERRPTFIQILRILESFTMDPAITGHKPMSTRNQNVVVRPSQVVDEEPQLNMAREFATVLNWRIQRADVEMDVNPMDELDINPSVAAIKAVANAASKSGDVSSTSTTVNRSSEEKELFTPRSVINKNEKSDEKHSSLTVTKPHHGRAKSMVSSILGADHRGMGAVQKQQLSQAKQNPDIHIAKYRGKTVAVKTCPLKQMNTAHLTGEQRVQADLEGHSSEQTVWDLMRLLGHVRHPNIVLFMGAYWENDHVGVVKEYMMRGTLEGIVKDTSLVLEWDTMLQLLIDAAQGMTYLHGMKPPIMHPDLSSSRLLVDKNWRVKIDDYGFVDLQSRIDGTPLPPSTWSAPEVLRDPNVITAASNVYSFGMIMYQLLVRKEPFEGEAFGRKLATRIITEKYRPPFPPSISRAFADLISRCWHDDPTQRPTFSDILATLQHLKSQGPPKVELIVGVNAQRYRKAKTVFAYRSKDPITMMKDWGKNVGKAGCIIILSGEDDVYLCDPEVFESTYERCEGTEHEYRKTGTVIATCMRDAFAVKTNGGVEHGMAGDYLVQNDAGDQWSIEAKTFNDLYELVDKNVNTNVR